MNFRQNLSMVLSNAQSLVLMSIVVIGIYLGFKREFQNIGFLVVTLDCCQRYSMWRCERCTVRAVQ